MADFVGHEPCPECGSKDNLARYADGSAYCFGCKYTEAANENAGRRVEPADSVADDRRSYSPVSGEHAPLKKRGITQETCQKFDYLVGTYANKPVQIANYRKGGRVVAQKVRFPSKDFVFLGSDTKRSGLFGQHLFNGGGRQLVITEGEIDALSYSQATGNKWPVVSVPKGAAGAVGSIKQELEYVDSFDRVVIMFDMDEPGREAASAVAELLPGKAAIAELPLKDANEMLVAGRVQQLVSCAWNAKTYTPEGWLTLEDLGDDLYQEPEFGLSWPWPSLTAGSFGIYRGASYWFGAGVGMGKTAVLTQIMAHLLREHRTPIGVISFEQQPRDTAVRIAGNMLGRVCHVPGTFPGREAVEAALKPYHGMLHMYSHDAGSDWEMLLPKIKFLVKSCGVKDIFLDNLTAVATGTDGNERETLERIMKDIGKLVLKEQITLYGVSHLATPNRGAPHERGGAVEANQFKGSRSIMQWANFIFGLERNSKHKDDDIRRTVRLVCLKDRLTGMANGRDFYMKYDFDTGMYTETKPVNILDSQDDGEGESKGDISDF